MNAPGHEALPRRQGLSGPRSPRQIAAAPGLGRRRASNLGPEVLAQSAGRVRRCRCAPALTERYYFRLTLGGGALRITGDSTPDDGEARWRRDTILAHARRVRHGDGDIAVVYGGGADEPAHPRYIVTVRKNGYRLAVD